MRIDKIPASKSHTLIAHNPGKNRFQPGKYVCICGATLSGINKFETHIALSRKQDAEESA